MTDGSLRLRRLEVQGFKSFATRTVFAFGPGITAIVGPNGSGKSNLADALRWVLGEQSPRIMRLRRLEDAIFAGGGKRAQSGVAEVSLVLDNTSGWLPLDFEEVVVTRRLHRSGESEYLLNRRRVRLRDVIDLFMKARLGQNSYAILGQGMVDTVLSLRPDERRALIEEAADVRRHRMKIDEAVAQLIATRENCDRIELLVAEIAPRLAPLERQAQRAAEHATLSRDLAVQLRLLFVRRARAARTTLAEAQRRCTVTAIEAQRAAVARAEAEQRLSALRSELDVATVEGQRLDARWRELDEARRDVERALKAASERLPQLESRSAELARDLATLQQEAEGLAAEAAAAVSPQVALDEAEHALAEAEQSLREATAEVARTRRLLDEVEQAHRTALNQRAGLAENAARREAQMRQLEAESARLDERARNALVRLRPWAIEFRDGHRRRLDLDRRNEATQAQLTEARRRAHAAELEHSTATAAASDLAARLDGVTRKSELLAVQQEARRPAEDVVVTLLDALRGGGAGRPRVLGIFGGLIHVQRGFEIAIEAALAEALNGLVVRTEQEALAAVSVLQEIEAGRLSFFVLEGTHGGHQLMLSNENGVLGVAASLVRCEPEYRALVDAVLGRVIVVEDLAAARRIVQSGLGTAVTTDGTVMRVNGSVSGGRGRADGAIFRAGTELADLEQERAALEREHMSARSKADQLRQQTNAALARVRSVEQSVGELNRSRGSLDRALADLQRRLAPMRGDLEWVRASRAQLGEQRAAQVASAPVTASPQLEQRLLSLAADVRAAAEQVTVARERDASRNTAVFELRGRRAALLAERAAREDLERRRTAARERTAALLLSRRAGLDRLAIERTEVETLARRLTLEQGQRADEADAALTLLRAAQSEAKQLAEQLQPRTDALATARAEQTSAERTRLDAELAAAKAQEALDQLDAELQAEGLTLADTEFDASTSVIEGVLPAPSITEVEASIRSLRRRIRDLGGVNDDAETEFRQTKERHEFLTTQLADLRGAESTLLEAIEQLRGIVREQFRATFQSVNEDFQVYFRLFFGGGQAKLVLAEPEDYGESGVDVIAQPPGKRLQNLAMLSGGERSMTAVALLFALLESSPAPFCVLDEVDAALDEANVGRFSEALTRLAGRSQFLVITHNRGTVQAADQIYGVSMTGDGVSSVLSMRLSEAAPLFA